MRPICVKCKVEMTCMKNEVVVWHPIEPENGLIDFVISGDRFECPKCKANVITGFGQITTANEKSQKWLKEFINFGEEEIEILRR